MGTHSVWKESGRLADGREIFYFDESSGLARAAAADRRPLRPPPEPSGSVLRWDALAGEWVAIAPQRQDRTFLPPPEECPLCPSRDGRLTEIPAGDYDVVVFENRYPALRGPDGRCEVVCFTPDHDASVASLPLSRIRTVLEAWVDRTVELSGRDGIAQVYCFENRGEEIGVTLRHPHGQIYAFSFVTPRTGRMLEQARDHAARTGRNLFEDLVAAEIQAEIRVVARNEHWVAFVPEAARWPYEVRLFPARRVASLPELNEAERANFPHIYKDLLCRFDALFGQPAPYISAWHQAPGRDQFARAEFGLHCQIFTVRRAPGKLKYLAGTESGMGAWMNDIAPEDAARRLREA